MKKNPSVYIPLLRRSVELDKPVFHNRFLWHVTYDSHDLNWLIAKQGLIPPYLGGVFAHNRLTDFENMYPYFDDRYDWRLSRMAFDGTLLRVYSFWRIDTRLCDNVWYIDPAMIQDAKYLGVSSRHYLCTPQAVPPAALRLYHYDDANFMSRNPRIYYKNGTAHIRPVRDDFDTLAPNEEVNRYIRSKAA